MIVRKMQLEDIEQVKQIDRLSFSLPWPSRAYHYELLENENSTCWVAEIESKHRTIIAGMAVIWLILDEAHIATIAIHPDYRQRGIAKEILRKALIDVVERGAVTATLEVRASNVAAMNLYQYYGFQIVGRRLQYYSDNHEDAVLMTVFNLGTDYLEWLEDDAHLPWKVHLETISKV